MNNEELFKQILAQQVVLFKMIKKIEVHTGMDHFKSPSVKTILDDLNKEANKIIDQIDVKNS